MAKVKAKKKQQAMHLRFRKSLWNLDVDGVTQSFLNSYMTCREQTRLRYVEGYASSYLQKGLEFGSLCHWVLSHVYLQTKKPTRAAIYVLVEKYMVIWRKENPIVSSKNAEMMLLLVELAKLVLLRYIDRYRGDWTGKYYEPCNTIQPAKWKSTEETFAVPFKLSSGRVILIRGMFDGVFADKRNRLWLFETKCLSRIDEEGIQDTLPLNTQVLLYLWALEQILGKRPAGVLYNVLRRPGQREKKGERPDEYAARVKEEVCNPKNVDHYFIRWQVEFGKEEIPQFVEDFLRPILDEVERWWIGDLPHYMNPAALITKYGRSPFFHLLTKGSKQGLFKRKHAFNELVEFSE